MTEYYDNGYEVTDESLKFWKRIRPKLGKIKCVRCWFPEGTKEKYNTVVYDDKGNMVWLSGFACGYGGTDDTQGVGSSPHGLLQLLKSEGFDVTIHDIAKTRLFEIAR